MTPFEYLQQERPKYPFLMSDEQIGELLNKVAWQYRATGMALLGKESGSNVPTPSGKRVSSDFLVHVPTKTGHDIFTNNASQNAILVPFEWGPGPENLSSMIAGGARSIVLPSDPGGGGSVPGPTPTPSPATNYEARIATLEQQVKNLNENILARLGWLENGQTGPDHSGTGTGKVFGYPISVQVTTKPVPKAKS
jgi:hypothetical protein